MSPGLVEPGAFEFRRNVARCIEIAGAARLAAQHAIVSEVGHVSPPTLAIKLGGGDGKE